MPDSALFFALLYTVGMGGRDAGGCLRHNGSTFSWVPSWMVRKLLLSVDSSLASASCFAAARSVAEQKVNVAFLLAKPLVWFKAMFAKWVPFLRELWAGGGWPKGEDGVLWCIYFLSNWLYFLYLGKGWAPMSQPDWDPNFGRRNLGCHIMVACGGCVLGQWEGTLGLDWLCFFPCMAVCV